MASKSKKLVALLLTAMVASTALVGCGDDGGDDPKPVSVPSPVTSTPEQSSPSPVSGDKVDLNDPATIQTIKDNLAKEAEEKGSKITIKLWCAADDMAFEKSRIEEFKTKFADSRYEFKISVVSKGEGDAGG